MEHQQDPAVARQINGNSNQASAYSKRLNVATTVSRAFYRCWAAACQLLSKHTFTLTRLYKVTAYEPRNVDPRKIFVPDQCTYGAFLPTAGCPSNCDTFIQQTWNGAHTTHPYCRNNVLKRRGMPVHPCTLSHVCGRVNITWVCPLSGTPEKRALAFPLVSEQEGYQLKQKRPPPHTLAYPLKLQRSGKLTFYRHIAHVTQKVEKLCF